MLDLNKITKGFIATSLLLGSISATYAVDLKDMSYYIVDSTIKKAILVMPKVEIGVHTSGTKKDYKSIKSQFASEPTFNSGTKQLCFSALAAGAAGSDNASDIAGKCYTVDFFYIPTTEKVTSSIDTSKQKLVYLLYYVPTGSVTQHLAGEMKKDGYPVADVTAEYTKNGFKFDPATGASVSSIVVSDSLKPSSTTPSATPTTNTDTPPSATCSGTAGVDCPPQI